MPLKKDDVIGLCKRRHPSWSEFQRTWRWLQDSLEGGDRYRHADYYADPLEPPRSDKPWYAYGYDPSSGEAFPFAYTQIVMRNLIPHQTEMSVTNRDLYTLRLSRTPVPCLVGRVIRRYLSRIYSREVKRSGPVALQDFWADVDGSGTEASKVDKWMRKTIAPLVLALGQLDLVFGHPEVPAGAAVKTRADERRLKVLGCIVDYILPENLIWWEADRSGRYRECLVFERQAGGSDPKFRHWTAEGCDVYTADGEYHPGDSFEYPYGRPPIVRVFDDKKYRDRMVGQSRMEAVADLQKSVYNRQSELILGDVLHSHPLLQGPEDYVQDNAKLPLGPGGMLPMKRTADGSYQGFGFVDTPQTGSEATRRHVQDDQEEVDREAALCKPAGMATSSTTGQSGISKQIDQREGNDVLSEVSETLAECERQVARMAMLVLSGGDDEDPEGIVVEYPREFDLFTASDLSEVLADIQAIAADSGVLPETEIELMKRLILVALPGLDKERMAELHTEVEETVRARAEERDAQAEARPVQSVAPYVSGAIGNAELAVPIDSRLVNTNSSAVDSPELS
jgi:hypothetical protein